MTLAAEDGASVISISSGMLAVNDAHPCPHLQTAVQQIMSRTNRPAIVAAAGNNGDTEKVYPAALEGVIAVAALQAVDEPISNPPPPTTGAEWSSHGPWVDCSAVGEGIVSTFVNGYEDQQFGTDHYPQDSWAVWSGTSFAAPQIAAHIAKHCRDHDRTPQQAVMDLFPPAGVPSADGYGKHVLLLAGTPPTPPPPPNP
jgi:thermitase